MARDYGARRGTGGGLFGEIAELTANFGAVGGVRGERGEMAVDFRTDVNLAQRSGEAKVAPEFVKRRRSTA